MQLYYGVNETVYIWQANITVCRYCLQAERRYWITKTAHCSLKSRKSVPISAVFHSKQLSGTLFPFICDTPTQSRFAHLDEIGVCTKVFAHTAQNVGFALYRPNETVYIWQANITVCRYCLQAERRY